MGNAVTNPIDPLFYAWNLDHNFYALTEGWSKLIDTNIFYPETNTLAFSDHLFGQTIFLFPLFFFLRNPLLRQNLYILSTFALAAFGTFLLVKYFTRSRLAAFIAGLIYSFSLYHFDHLSQVTTTSIQWLPFALLYLFKALKTDKTTHFLLFWLFFTLNFLSTIYYGIFLTIVLGLFLTLKFRDSQKIIIKLTLFSLPFLLLLLFTSYPYIRFRLENPEFRRTLEESSWRSANISDYLRRLPVDHDRALFPGSVAFILTAGSFLIRKKKFPQNYFISLLFLSFILSLGPEKWGIKLPYYYLYKTFPLMQAIRVPARFAVLTILSFSVLSGIALTTLLSKKQLVISTTIVSQITKSFLLVTLIFVFLESLHIPVKLIKVPTLSQAPQVYHWLAQQKGDFAILELPLRSGLNSNPIENQVYKNYGEITEYDNFMAETFRVYFSILHRKKMLNGYSSYFPPSYIETAQLMEKFPSKEAMDLIRQRKVKYLIVHTKEYGKRWQEIEKQLLNFPEVKLEERFAQDSVYIL